MILLTFAAFQAVSGLSTALPPDERLRFVFARDDRSSAKIAGSGATPTSWSTPTLFNIVQQCGGKGLGVARSNARRIVVTGESGANNLEVARCVQASTSVRFWAGVQDNRSGSRTFDQQPFRALWSD
jgi:hypothetical protein